MVNCSLSQIQVENLYKLIYKQMLNSLESDKAFAPEVFMTDLFEKIQKKTDVNTASTFLQIVPTLMKNAVEQDEIDTSDFDFDLNANKELITKFRNTENGLLETLKHFRPEATLEDLEFRMEIEKGILNTPLSDQGDDFLDMLNDPFRWQADDAFTSTMQEFSPKNPDEKDTSVKEEKDPNKKRIYKAIRTIKEKGVRKEGGPELIYQGKVLKLKTENLLSLNGKGLLDATTVAFIIKSNAIVKKGNSKEDVTAAKDIIALVVADENGNILYFDENSNLTTKEDGGQAVYQFLRDVRPEKNSDKLRVTDIYGIEDRILSPAELIEKDAHNSKMSMPEYKKWLIDQGTTYEDFLELVDNKQQKAFKELQDLRDEVRAGQDKLLNITDISTGIVDIFYSKENPTLKELLTATKKTAEFKRLIGINPTTFYAEILINDVNYAIDRSNLPEEYINQIAAVLINPKLNNKQKHDFYLQFTSNTINTQTRKLFVNYYENTGTLTAGYRPDPKTNKQLISITLTDSNAEQIIIDSLLNESIVTFENKGFNAITKTYSTQMSYNKDIIAENKAFYNYNRNTGKFNAVDYFDFLLSLDLKILNPADKKTNKGDAVNNPYFQFRIDKDFIAETEEVKEEIKSTPVDKIKEAKDDLVLKLKVNKDLSGTILSGMSKTDATFLIKVDGVSVQGRYEDGVSSNDVNLNDPVTFIVNDISPKIKNVVSIYKGDKKIGQVSETDFTLKPKVTKKPGTPQQEAAKKDEPFINPDKVDQPDEESDIPFELDRSSKLPNNVTQEEITAAKEWWDSSPLSKLIKLEHMANIVNSDVYARFIIAGKRLSDVSIQLDTATGGTAVDLYHEAWHAFSQLFLTKSQKTKLYAETRKRLNNYELAPEEVEEILAEEYRDYAKDPKAVGDAPIRNTIFRRIWNIIKALFGKRSIQEDLFERLFFASKNPKLLNKYTPLVDNHMFNKLNRARGVFNTETKELVLNYQDSLKVSTQIDSVLSRIIDEEYDNRLTNVINNVKDKAGKLVTANKTGTIQILTVEANKIQAYARTKKRFNAKLAEFKTELEATTQEDFNKRSLLNNKIRILEAAITNWDNVLEFHKEHSTFDLIKQKYIEIDEEESETEGDTTGTEVVEETEKFSDKKVGEKSLMQLAEKETLYILKSLFKIVDGKEVEGSLGFPELVDFSKIWNTVTKVIGGEKDPVKMYLKLQAAVPFYPELGQLVNKKFPDPRNIKTLQEFNIKAAFWQDFKKPLIRYVQLTVGIDEETDAYKSEVTDASIEFKNIINSFKSAFNSSAETKYISKGANNKSTLKLDVLMKAFPDATSVDLPAQQIQFINALGVGLQDLISIKNELIGKSREYGIPYIHQIAKEVYTLSKDPKLTNDKQKEFIKKFIDNPIDALYGKIPAGIHKDTNSQKSVIQKLARLQNKFGNNYASFSVLNAEKKLVNEFTEDSTVTMQVDAINNVINGRDLWMNPEYSYMSYLNPLINGFTEQSQLLKSIFKVEENTWDRKKDGRLDLVMVSGTQIVNVDGANTTSLDIHGKYIQELNMMLKSGFQEFMRHASKSASFGMKSTKIKNLYVDIDQFKPGGDADQYAVDNIFLGYIQAELIRIQKIRANKEEYKKYVGYNREIKSADGETVLGMAGEFFTAFDNILTKDTKEEIIEKVKNGKLLDYLESDPKLKEDITEQVIAYFKRQSADNKKDFQKSKWIDPALTNSLKKFELSTDDEETMLIKAHTMNAWIHNFETASLIYGDVVQYNHAKQELHKRNPGSTSGGRGFMTDQYTQNFLNSDLIKNTSYGAKLAAMDDFGSDYTPFNYSRTYNTAIMQEVKRSSVYIKNIEKGLREDYKNRGLSQSEIDYRLKKELKPYKEMEEGDGQGYITIDAYRLLRLAEKNWSSEQEDLFQKVISGKEISTEDITQIFPVYKLQNFGHLANTSLPVNAMHKFALMPLIPSLIAGSDLESLHHQMMKNNIQYATFQSGSKVGGITSQVDKNGKAVADQIYDDNGTQKTLKSDIAFTKNTIYLAYLKNVTAVPIKLKGKTVFSTQLRALILEGLYENGKLVNKAYTPFVKAYEDAVDSYTEILKTELLNEIGYEYKDGKYVSGDLTKFMDVVQRELTRKDLPEHLIDYIQVGSNNVLTKDLSLHMLSGDIEKMITSLVEKRIVKQKVKGEALVQVASSMTNGLWDKGFKFEKAQIAEIEKYLGTNNLPFYNPGEDGNTSAMKVAIALQGDFKNLLKLKDLDGVEIGTRKRLNELIKDDEWLNKDNNRKSVTLSAVRIPVQGMNSMEFMEVYEFLDPAAGSIIIPPSEIVAKSGADYDVDKLTTFMPNIDLDGNYVTSNISEETLKKLIANAESKGDKAAVVKLIALQKKAIENRLIDSIRGILQLPDNYATLVRPNETYLMKDIADELVDSLPEYGRYKTISPTNVFEVGYNLAKHDYNMTGKDVLGIIALENKLHPLYTALGAALPKTYYGSVKNPKTKKYEDDTSIIYEMRLLLDHNETEDGRISLSGINSVDGQDKIADLFSHLMNGSVDVEKDAWIFFIQANKELIPMLLNLLKAGVPKRDAVYFISQPLVKEYANQQRLYDGVYANLTGKETLSDENKKYNALLDVLKQTDISESIYKANRTRLSNAIKGYNKEAKVSVKLSGVTKPYNTTLKSLIADIKADKVKINDIELVNSSETGPLFKSIIADPNNEFYHPMSTPNYKDVVLAATEGMDKFTTADLKETMTNNDTTSPKAIAIFLHYVEYEKQIKDMSDLKRQSNPDTATSKTIQEIMQRKIGLDILSESSKIDQNLVNKLRKESILGSFFDNVITQDLVEPIFPLTNDKRVSAYLLNYIKNNNIPLKFGEGADGITNFITSFKQAMINYIYQNKLNEIITTKEPFPGVPELFSTLNHQAYVTRFMSMISENSHLKELYSVLEQITDVPINIFDSKTKRIKGQISVLTLNNKPVVKGALADSYHQNLIDLADENVIKVKDPVKNKKISDMFKILPLISILQNGVGNTKYGLSYVLPDTTYFEIVEPASREFISNKMNTSTFDKIAAMMIANDPNVNNYIDESIIFKSTDQPSTSVKEGVEELFNSNPELSSIGTAQQYSQYLDNIFPNSKVKDIVYRGSEKEDNKLFQYWTNNRTEAYMYAKANVTKGGNITERIPIRIIKNNLKKYINDKYGEKTFESYILDKRDYLNQVSETEYELQLPTWYKEDIKLDKQDENDFLDLETLEFTYNIVKIEDEDDLDKPYTVNDYDIHKKDYDKARNQLDKYFNIEELGKIKTALLNVKNPYTEEIVQEDLQNNRDAYKNGHDGAFLMDGDHFLVKSNTDQIYELGNKQDIEGFKEFITQSSTSVNSNDIYSQLENKNVVISNIKTKDGKYDRDANIKEAKANNRVYTMEMVSDINSFSNPWAHFIRKGTIKTNTTKEAVINYIDWLTTDKFKDVKPKRKAFILDVLKSGKLKGRQLQYYAELGEPSHATALDYLINKYDWNTQSSTSVNPADFTNYHGGAKKYDTYWEQEGKNIGVTKHTVYTVDSYDKLDQAIKDKLEIRYEAARTWLGRGLLAKNTYNGKLVRRDMMQAARADSIFAVSEIVAPGIKGRKTYINKTNHPIIEGGTGYAVASAILLNKPVYVFNQDSSYGYKTGWYKWDSSANNFVKTDTPVLTKNYAGIGSSTNETEIGKQAIKDVYANTFKATQPSTSVEKVVYDNNGLTIIENGLSEAFAKSIVPDLVKQIESQSYKQTKSASSYDFGTRWTRMSDNLSKDIKLSFVTGMQLSGYEITKEKLDRWVAGETGTSLKLPPYGYNILDQYGKPLRSIPSSVIIAASNATGLDLSTYQASYNSVYDNNDQGNLIFHQDNTEQITDAPIVTLSLGLPMKFVAFELKNGSDYSLNNQFIADPTLPTASTTLKDKFINPNGKSFTLSDRTVLVFDGKNRNVGHKIQFDPTLKGTMPDYLPEISVNKAFTGLGQEDRYVKTKDYRTVLTLRKIKDDGVAIKKFDKNTQELVYQNGIYTIINKSIPSTQQQAPVIEAPVVKIETVIKEREPVSFNNTFTFSDGVEIKTGIIRLNEQQKTALQLAVDAINNKNTKFVLKGYAGTGKSTIAKFIQLYVNTKHRGMKEIVYAAPTHKASINLLVQLIRGGVTKKPITTAKLLNKRKIDGVFKPGPKHAVPSNGILIIDESSMIDNSDYKDIYELAQDNNTTVIFMGDPAQLPPVGNSSLSPALTYTKDNEGYELTEIMRQKEDNPVLKIITGIRNNMLDIKENFNFDTEINSEGEGVNFMKNKTDFNNKILDTFTSEEYQKDPSHAKIIAYSNVAVALYNQQVFSSMNIDEAYGVGSTLMGYEQSSADSIINNGQDYTVISNEYQESKDTLLYNEYIKNTQHTIQGKLSGWNIEVKRVFNESDTELIKKHSPQLLKPEKVFIINPRDSNNLNILMQFLAVKKAINDNTISWKYRADASSELDSLFSKYQFPDDVLLFENQPTTMSILKKENAELFKIEADGTSKYEKLNIKAFFSKNIDYGYAVTAHKAQGSTYDNVFVDYENMDNPANDKIINYNGKPYGNERNMLRYVGLSRTSKMDYVYTNKASDVSNVAPIVKQLQEEVPDGQTGEVIVKKPEPEERNIKVDQYTFTIKPDGKIYYGNGKELTEQTIKNKVYIRKELQDGTLRVSSYNKSNYYVLSDNTILGSGTTNLAKETVSDPLTKERILDAASLYKKSC